MADKRGLEERIAALELEIATLRADMERAGQEFLAATATFAAVWFEWRVEQVVVANAEVAKLLGREGLKRLKGELRTLVARVPELVQLHVNRDRHWAHRPTLIDDSLAILNPAMNPYGFRGDRPPALINAGVQDVLRHTSALLEQFGFSAVDRGEPESTSFVNPRKPVLAFEWNDAMRATLTRYGELYERLRRANSELRPLRRKLGDVDVKRLWDEA